MYQDSVRSRYLGSNSTNISLRRWIRNDIDHISSFFNHLFYLWINILEFWEFEVVLLYFFFLVWCLFLVTNRHFYFLRRFLWIFVQHLHHCISLSLCLCFLFSIDVADDVFDWSGRSIGDSISKLFIGNRYSIIFLSFLDFNFDFIIFSKISDLLNMMGITLESIHPFLTPYLFIATKFLGGSFTFEPYVYCQPDTTK